MAALGRMLIVLGIIIIAVGLILLFAPKIPHIGRLPGDIYVKKDSFTFYFPLTTCVIISLILTLIFWIFRR
jgi:uncharacterized membrane protein